VKRLRLRNIALVFTSNVDKVIDPEENAVRLCNYVDVYKNNFIDNEMSFSAGSATNEEIKKFQLRTDDVVITKDSETRHDIGIPALVKTSSDDLICGYHLSILRAHRGIMIGSFLYWHLLSKPTQEEFGNAANGVTRFGLTLGGIKGTPINVPDLPTQRAIADFLDRETARIDLLIEKKKRFLSLLTERETNFIGGVLSGDSIASSSRKRGNALWLQNVPQRWDVVPLRYLVRIRTGSRDSKDREDDGLYPFFVRSMTIERINTYSFDEEAVLTSGDGAGVGNVFHHINCKFELHQRMYAFTDFERVTGRYFYYFLRTFFSQQMTQWSAKSTVDSVRMPFLKTLRITVPPHEEQVRIIEIIEERAERDKHIRSMTLETIDRLREYRSALITAAVTGQIDVTKWAKAGTADCKLDAVQATINA